MHRFLGFPRRSGTVMHHFLNGLPELPHTIFVERGFVRIARHQGPDPSRSEASHLDFPLEIASEAFNPANFFAARPSSCTISYPETGKLVARFLRQGFLMPDTNCITHRATLYATQYCSGTTHLGPQEQCKERRNLAPSG